MTCVASKVIIEQTCRFDEAASAVAHVLRHHACGKAVTAWESG